MGMDIKKIGQLDSSMLRPNGMGPGATVNNGPSFQETLAGIDRLIEQPKANAALASTLKFSNHAVERMRTRGVSFTPEQMTKLEGAVKKAAEKGGKDSLVLMNDTALIVSVKNNTVVTVVDKTSLKENVFTNIDSTIVI